MNLTQQPTTTVRPVPTPFSRFSKKLAIIIFIVVAVLLLLFDAGGYYYLEIYQPAQYSKAVIPIYDEIRTQQVEMNFKGGGDYEGAVATLDQYETSFTNWRNQLRVLNPSPISKPPSFLTNAQRSQQIQEDFTKILDFFISNIADTKQKVHFMIKAKDLFLLLKPDLTEYPPKAVPTGQGIPLPPPPNTAGEFLAVWEVRVPKAKLVAQDLFNEPQDLGDVSFDELKSLWQETEQGFDVIIPFLKKQDSNLPLRDAQKLVPESDKSVFAKVDKIDEFLPKLENVLIRNNAENILMYQFAINNSNKLAFETRSKRLDNNIKHLKEKYGQ